MVHSTKAITGSNGSVNISANIGASSRALMQSVIDPLHAWNSTDSSKREALRDVGNDSHLTNAPCGMSSSSDIDLDSNLCYSFDASFDDADEQADDIDTTLLLPEQNIDVEGKNSGKKLTEDLDDIKDKMHEVTWHLFDDQAYVIKNSNTIYFGDGKKAEKKRKSDVKKQLDKYLGLRQYSHTNPFVARVGMYVEPIIGSSYSFLCLFRAGFNVLTWQDPIMTFWLSLFCGVLVIILFIFPWRLFFFVVGVFVVGPQNWVIRILRDRGHLPLAPKYKGMSNKHLLFSEEINGLPKDAPIFTSEDRRPGNEPRNAKPLSDDPREIHHVVVPYTPLKYQRCYDWPPEAQYAQVKRELPSEEKKKAPNKDLPASQHKSRNVTTNDTSKAQNQQRAGLRSRFRRRNAAENTLDRPPHSPNRRRMSLESSFLSD